MVQMFNVGFYVLLCKMQHRAQICNKNKQTENLGEDLQRHWTFVPRQLLQQTNTNTEITQGLNLVISHVGL